SVPRAALLGHYRQELRAQAARADADEAAGKSLDEQQKRAQSDWAEVMENYQPDAETLQGMLDAYRGGYGRLFARRAPLVRGGESWDFYGWAFFDLAGTMLIGMGLLRLGVLTASRSRRFYVALAAIG